METRKYKEIIQFDDVLEYQILQSTLRELRSSENLDLARRVQEILTYNKIAKPLYHSDQEGRSTTYYKVNLEEEDVKAIIDMFGELEALAVDQYGEITPQASVYSALLDAWMSCVRH